MTSVSKFKSTISKFEKPASASGKKLGKAEVQTALKVLTADGKVSKVEVKAAKDVLANKDLTKGASDTLKAFVASNETGVTSEKNLKSGTLGVILAKFQKAESGGKVHWMPSLPLGPRFHTEELMRERHPDGFTYSVMIPVGGNNPTAPRLDPNKAKTYYVQKTGGFAGITQYAGPFNMPAPATKGGAASQVHHRTGGSVGGGGGGSFGGGGIGS